MRSLMHAGTRFYAMVRRETASCAHVEPNCSSGTATNHVRHMCTSSTWLVCECQAETVALHIPSR